MLPVVSPVEGANAIHLVRKLQDFRVANGADDILVAGDPVLLHGPAGELVVLGDAFVVLGVINQLHDIADFLVSLRREQAHFRTVQQFGGKVLHQAGEGYTELLGLLVLISCRPRATGELDFLQPHLGFAEIARQFTARTPEVDLEGQCVQPRSAVEHPLQWRVGNEAAVPIIVRRRSRWPENLEAVSRWR